MLLNGRMELDGLILSANTLDETVVVGTAYGQDDSELFLQTNGEFTVEYTADGVKQTTTADFDSSAMRFSATWKPDNGTATKIRGTFTTLTTNVSGTIGNKFTSLDFSRKNLITEIQVPNGAITTLNLSGCTQLASLSCYNNSITQIKLNTTALKYCVAHKNKLTSIDFGKNTALTYLNVSSNQLTALDVSKNTALTQLLVVSNQLTALDVSKNTALTYLNVNSNQLTALDVSKNTALTYLYMSNAHALQELNLSNDKITTLYMIMRTGSNLHNIIAVNASATVYDVLNKNFATFAAVGTLTTDNTDASAVLRATAAAKGWTVTIEE